MMFIISFLRSVIFYLLYPFTGMMIGVLGLMFVHGKPFQERYDFITGWNRFIVWYCKLTCGINYKVIGRENIPAEGAYVVMSKHQSQWETFYFQILFNPLITVLKRELLKVPGFGWGLGMLDPIAIDRGSPKQALKQINEQGKQRLEDGIPVLIFPEGTRIPYGEAGKYTRGGAMLACNSNVPVLPVAHNAGKYWPSDKFVKFPGTITVSIGPPIYPDGKNSKELTELVQQWIESEVERIDREPS